MRWLKRLFRKSEYRADKRVESTQTHNTRDGSMGAPFPRRCGNCGRDDVSLELHRDWRQNRLFLCQQCFNERKENVDTNEPQSYTVFAHVPCDFRILGGSSVDRSGKCANCGGSLDDYTNLQDDAPSGRSPHFH
jgi:hypothetical protein